MTLSAERSSAPVADLDGRRADLWIPPPRFITPRNPELRTLGGAVAKTARALGKPLLPWQRVAADVGGEVDDRGVLVHPLVLVTVQRQSGKTTLDLAQSVQRCLGGPRRKIWHTAQTGQDARKKWRELADDVMTSPLRQVVDGRPRSSNGAESLVFVNGSNLRPHPPTRDALHGEQSDMNNVDEAWVFDELQGADLFQAITPTQTTRPGAQTWVWSTRGDRGSVWFHGLIEAIRAGAIPGAVLIDFGIPDDLDPTDLPGVLRYHAGAHAYPGQRPLVTIESLQRAQATLSPGEFARAFGNRATGAGERVIPMEAWEAARTVAVLPAGRPAYGVAVAGDGSAGAIVAAVLDAAGRPWVEVVQHRPGRSWLVEAVRDLHDAGQGVAIDRRGPAAPVADQLELAGVTLLPLGGTDYAAACQDVYDRLLAPAPRLIHRADEALELAADVAARRTIGDGGWIWSRAKSTGDVSPLEAATLAAWAVLRNPPAAVAPFILFG